MSILKKFGNNVAEQSETLGALDYELQGALEGYFRFRDEYADGDKPYYAVVNATETKKEYNKGDTTLTHATPDTLLRDVWRSTSNNDPVVWEQDDLPLMVYVPTSGEMLEAFVTGWLATARNAMLSFGFWWKDEDPSAEFKKLYIYDGVDDIPFALLNSVDNSVGVMNGVVGRASHQYSTVETAADIIPVDNTIPQQSTEGVLKFTITYTPKFDAGISKIRLKLNAYVTISNPPNSVVAAVFQDSTEDAIFARTMTILAGSAGTTSVMTFEFDIETGFTAGVSTTYKVNIGSSLAGTVTINGASGVGHFGGKAISGFYLEEYLA